MTQIYSEDVFLGIALRLINVYVMISVRQRYNCFCFWRFLFCLRQKCPWPLLRSRALSLT